MVTAASVSAGLKLEPVNAICRRVLGKRVSPATLWRWIKRGVKGGRLDAVCIAGKWHCTAEAFADFLNRQTAANLLPEPAEVGGDDSDEALRAAGLL